MILKNRIGRHFTFLHLMLLIMVIFIILKYTILSTDDSFGGPTEMTWPSSTTHIEADQHHGHLCFLDSAQIIHNFACYIVIYK